MTRTTRAAVVFVVAGIALVGLAVGLGPRASERGAARLPSVPAPSAPTRTDPPRALPSSGAAPAPVRRMFQRPSLSATAIAFDYAGEIWVVPRAGGEATRLVSGQLRNSRPIFSPDGTQIAFTGVYDGNTDVYVVPTSGGEARRLTYHPAIDEAVGWTPDGTRVLLRSWRKTPRDLPQLFTLATTGGDPTQVPLPSANEASLSPDGTRIAFTPFPQSQPEWKHYRGGQLSYIWVAALADSHVVKIPHQEANDRYPMWIGDTVYFVSDREADTYGLYAYKPADGTVRSLLRGADGVDIHFASAGPGAIVCERLDGIFLYDLATGKSARVPITLSADLPQLRPRFARVGPDEILNVAVSPHGKRVLVEAHGEILSVPAEKGDVRNLTKSPEVADREPSWSPDGQWIAWLSDASGEYALYLRSPDGVGDTKKITLGDHPSFFFAPRWSPDSKKLVLADKLLRLWLVDLAHPTPVKIDEGLFDSARFDPSWSPDARFIAYEKHLENQLRATFIYSLEEGISRRVSDGASDTSCPRFDPSGKYLWFLARTDVGIGEDEGMTSLGRPTASSVYGIVLRKDRPSPMAPQSDEEPDAGVFAEAAPKPDRPDEGSGDARKDKHASKGTSEEKDALPKAAPRVTIDFDGIDQRVVALPIERGSYAEMEVGGEGVLFLVSTPVALSDEGMIDASDEPPPEDIVRFDLKKRKATRFVEGIDGGRWRSFLVTGDGKKVLYAKGRRLFFASSEYPSGGGDKAKAIDTGRLEVWVDPRAEWRQMFHEVFRIERDYLYDAHAHGLDLAATEALYAPWLEGLGGRADLNALVGQALANLVLGHVWMVGGSLPSQPRVRVGLLGADFTVEHDRYRFARILTGESWNPGLRAPLTEPGVDVKEGDFLLRVDGQEVTASSELSRAFLGTGGKQTVIEVASSADGHGARKVVVVPIDSEASLRLRTWMEDNRKKVDALSHGKVAYVFVPDTAAEGYASFNRYYFSQVGKEAAVIDERFNHGGAIADHIVNALGWKPFMMNSRRDGLDTPAPKGIFGPKVLIANEMSGSGGDGLPWLFKRAKVGTLVGTRTWGGWVGIGGYPRLIDGGRVTAPRDAGYDFEGRWVIENAGVAPDVEVEQDPALVRQGHDPQLERAVELALEGLAKSPPPKATKPAYPDYKVKLPRFVAP